MNNLGKIALYTAMLKCAFMYSSYALAQNEGEWTGRGWVGPSSGGGGASLFGIFIIVSIIAGIIYLVNEGLPHFFPAMGGLLIIFVGAQITTMFLIAIGVNLTPKDSLWIFLVLLSILFYRSHKRDVDKKKKIEIERRNLENEAEERGFTGLDSLYDLQHKLHDDLAIKKGYIDYNDFIFSDSGTPEEAVKYQLKWDLARTYETKSENRHEE